MKSFMISTSRHILPLFTNTWLGIFVPATFIGWIADKNVSASEKLARTAQTETFKVSHPAECVSSRNSDAGPKP